MFESQLTISVIITKTGIMFYIKMCESGGFALLKKRPGTSPAWNFWGA
jgi:hypothetical protein